MLFRSRSSVPASPVHARLACSSLLTLLIRAKRRYPCCHAGDTASFPPNLPKPAAKADRSTQERFLMSIQKGSGYTKRIHFWQHEYRRLAPSAVKHRFMFSKVGYLRISPLLPFFAFFLCDNFYNSKARASRSLSCFRRTLSR